MIRHCEAFQKEAETIYLFVIASLPKAGVAISSFRKTKNNCFVAMLLAMTIEGTVIAGKGKGF
jgi:hypothetical protein